jgi:hypothetical protein
MNNRQLKIIGLLIYSTNYASKNKLYTDELFSDNFCNGFKSQFSSFTPEETIIAINSVLEKGITNIMDNPLANTDNYNIDDIETYLIKFRDKLVQCVENY